MLGRSPQETLGRMAGEAREEVRMILWFARAVLLFAGLNALVTRRSRGERDRPGDHGGCVASVVRAWCDAEVATGRAGKIFDRIGRRPGG
jgi:hypothetical protein